VRWGFPDAGGNSIGEITYLRSYSRLKDDGTKERWHETCARVINGMYSIQKDWCSTNRLPWNENQGRHSAEEAYDRMFLMKWLPPGRGIWMMGTKFVHERGNSAALQNCAFVSTGDMDKRHPEKPFAFLMEASMLGVGVGFDTEGAQKGIQIQTPVGKPETFIVPDSREGWVESMTRLLRSYLVPKQTAVAFDYSQVRPAGEPIKGFGGTAPLARAAHQHCTSVCVSSSTVVVARQWVSPTSLTSATTSVSASSRATCVGQPRSHWVSQTTRSSWTSRTTASSMTTATSSSEGPSYHRMAYGWMSNNSVRAEVGINYDPYVERIVTNGEPGFLYMDLARKYGRLVDPINNKDYRAKGVNPCGEQTLESYECCTLVETFPTNCDDEEDFKRTLKFAYLYAKSVTLVATHWPETNAVMQRNRRIGTSVSGLAQFVEQHGWTELRNWLNHGYDVVRAWDTMYSEWLGVRTSIKTTSIKPSGSVSLVAGVTPGVHWPTYGTYIRRMRLGKDDPLTLACEKAGYVVEPCIGTEETTVVVEFPVRGLNVRTEGEVSVFEKAALGVLAQRYWADNQVSMTLTFHPDTEAQHIGTILRMHEGQLKSLSFLPIKPTKQYKQLPYESISEDRYDTYSGLRRLDLELLYNGTNVQEAAGEAYCTTDKCEIKWDVTPTPGDVLETSDGGTRVVK
jgi:ribonucleoside-triphosphate reductase